MQCLLGGFKIKEGIKIFLVLLVFAIAITAYAIYASGGVAWCKTDVDTSGTITTRTCVLGNEMAMEKQQEIGFVSDTIQERVFIRTYLMNGRIDSDKHLAEVKGKVLVYANETLTSNGEVFMVDSFGEKPEWFRD